MRRSLETLVRESVARFAALSHERQKQIHALFQR